MGSTWVKMDNVVFGDQACNLYITRNDLFASGLDKLLDEPPANKPDLLLTFLQEILRRCRPELEGASIYAFGYNWQRCCWFMTVHHSSYAHVPTGCELPEERVDLSPMLEDLKNAG